MKIIIRKHSRNRDFTGAMTDISFLLIIFFLVTAVFMSSQGIILKLPRKNEQPRHLTPDKIVFVELLPDDRYLVNSKPVKNRESLPEYIKAGSSGLSEPVLVLQINDNVSYQEVLDILELSKTAGVSVFSIRYMEDKPRGLRIEAGTL